MLGKGKEWRCWEKAESGDAEKKQKVEMLRKGKKWRYWEKAKVKMLGKGKKWRC
jgi:hypothetical protein